MFEINNYKTQMTRVRVVLAHNKKIVYQLITVNSDEI